MRLFKRNRRVAQPVITRAGVAAMRAEVLRDQHLMSYHQMMDRLERLRRLDRELDAGEAQAGHEVGITLKEGGE